jgi:hypothetical protein
VSARMSDGYARLDGKDGTGGYMFDRSELERLRAALMKGEAWFTGQGLYGSSVTVRLAHFIAIADITPESFAASVEDERLTKREEDIR